MNFAENVKKSKKVKNSRKVVSHFNLTIFFDKNIKTLFRADFRFSIKTVEPKLVGTPGISHTKPIKFKSNARQLVAFPWEI